MYCNNCGAVLAVGDLRLVDAYHCGPGLKTEFIKALSYRCGFCWKHRANTLQITDALDGRRPDASEAAA